MSENDGYDYDDEADFNYRIACAECGNEWLRETEFGAKGIRRHHDISADHKAEINEI